MGDKRLVYVDDAGVKKHGYSWFHLMAENLHELHAFAASIGIPERAFHRNAKYPHYDITTGQRRRAIEEGAQPISSREAVRLAQKVLPEPNSTFIGDENQLKLFA